MSELRGTPHDLRLREERLAEARGVKQGKRRGVPAGEDALTVALTGFAFAKTFREHWAISRHRQQGRSPGPGSVLRSGARGQHFHACLTNPHPRCLDGPVFVFKAFVSRDHKSRPDTIDQNVSRDVLGREVSHGTAIWISGDQLKRSTPRAWSALVSCPHSPAG